MTETPDALHAGSQTYAEVEDALLARWPETKLDPTLDRIEAFMRAARRPAARPTRSIHLTGTNGKTSTARMIDDADRARSGCAPAGSPARTWSR